MRFTCAARLLVTVVAAAKANLALACKPYETYTAHFDNLPTGVSPPNNYSSVNWHGFTVVNATSTALFAASSGANVVQASAFPTSAIYISQASSGSHNFVFALDSFAFACATPYPPDSPDQWLIPADCGLQVVSRQLSEITDIQTFGTFEYTVNYSGKADPHWHMAEVQLGGVGASFLYFNLVSGSSFATLYLDNVVLTQQSLKCGYY